MRLRGARIHGRLDLDNLTTTVKLTLLDCLLDEGITAQAAHLPGVSVRRCLLTHASEPALHTAGWLDLLRTTTPAYAAQPYQQLASVNQAAGHDRDVRLIHIAQRQAQLDRGVLTGRDRLWARITGFTVGYGYQPWRALLILLGLVVTSVVLTVTLGAHGALIHQDPQSPAAAVPCSVTERIDVGLAVSTSFLNTNAQNRCITTDTATGIGLNYGTRALQLLTAAVAVLFVAGFTGIVRKT